MNRDLGFNGTAAVPKGVSCWEPGFPNKHEVSEGGFFSHMGFGGFSNRIIQSSTGGNSDKNIIAVTPHYHSGEKINKSYNVDASERHCVQQTAWISLNFGINISILLSFFQE
jgi:hypothetical protein